VHCDSVYGEVAIENFGILCDVGRRREYFMKSKKAVTLLTRVESLLSDVLDEYSVIEKQVEKNVRAGLLSAQESVKSAMKFISALPDAQISYKSGRSRAKGKTRAKTSVGAKKASAAGKRR
jgi:hypothetical protein